MGHGGRGIRALANGQQIVLIGLAGFFGLLSEEAWVRAKLGFTAGLVVGLLAGSRAGRGLYDRTAATASTVVNDPRVRRAASTALHRAGSAGSSVAGAASRKVAHRGRGEADEHDGDEGRDDGTADGAGSRNGRGLAGARRRDAAHHGRAVAGHSGDGGGRRGRGLGLGRVRERGHGVTHFRHGSGRVAAQEADGMTPGASRGMDGHPGISAPSAQQAARMSGGAGRPGESGKPGRSGG